MKKLLRLFLTLASGMLLLTCGDGSDVNPGPGPGPGNGPPPGSENLTNKQRMAVLKECADYVNTLGDLKSDATQQVLVNWLRAQPAFEEADTTDGNVWAYFHDG